jgi:hypothetical protein
MTDTLIELSRAVAASSAGATALDLLGNVPGFPPLVQTVHLLGVAAVMGSIVLIDLRVLGLALPTQDSADLTRRLMPWLWWALPFLAASGLVFVFAQPHRYATNPIFGLKFALLVPALLLALVVHRAGARNAGFWDASPARRVAAAILALCSLALWIGVVMAGRWIAYADYLFPE